MKKKKERQIADIEYRSSAEPRAMAGDVPVFCAHDELLELAKIIPNPKNPNEHPFEQVKLLAEVIKAQGWRAPITISRRSGFIVAGHGRLAAAYAMGADVAPVDYQNFASEAEEYAALVADNRIAELAELNDAKLADILSDIAADTDIDTLLSGYTEEELEDLLLSLAEEEDPVVEEDDYEVDLEITPFTKAGYVYQLGNHRLMCGDSTKSADVEKLMNNYKCDIAFTSPPYNAGKTPDDLKNKKTSKYMNDSDNKSTDEYTQFLLDFTRLTIEHAEYSFVNIQSVANNKISLIDYMYELKEYFADTIIWDKCNAAPAMGENILNSQWEYVHVFSHEAKRRIGVKPFRGTLPNIIQIPKQHNNEYAKIHNATFPMEFAAWFVDNFSVNSVLDLFGGTGTTLIVCENLGRSCYTMELDPVYCDVIIDRYIKFKGSDADVFLLHGDEKIPIAELRDDM